MAPPRMLLTDISMSEVRLDPRANPLQETPAPRFARSEVFERHVDRTIVVADIFRDAAGHRILLLVRPFARYWNPLSELSIRCAESGRVIPATRFLDVTLSGPEWLALDAP